MHQKYLSPSCISPSNILSESLHRIQDLNTMEELREGAPKYLYQSPKEFSKNINEM